MAISDFFQFEVTEEINKCVAKGMPYYEAVRWLAKSYSHDLEREVSHIAIDSKCHSVKIDKESTEEFNG
ncbi:MAG: hypothetical protein K9L30_11690 [Desulfobacterales bacterium]|nr:hypothetical protein [Desulfobacterales bacterium]